ncbi:type 1 fimbrial protein [Salmonella enterica]|nr:type 1 fimbrial protein [Salmonella enterica]
MKNRLYRAAVLVTAMLLPGLTVQPARAAKNETVGTVNFTGAMLGESTCTLENPQVTVDFGTINVDRKGAVPANPLGSPRTVTFRLTKCASYIQKVNMTVNFDAAPAWEVTDLIGNQGTAGRVAGVLTCPAEAPAQGVNCTAGNRFSTGETVSGTVTNGGVSFPLTVSLVTFDSFHPSAPHMPGAGSINMTVNFTFEEA